LDLKVGSYRKNKFAHSTLDNALMYGISKIKSPVMRKTLESFQDGDPKEVERDI